MSIFTAGNRCCVWQLKPTRTSVSKKPLRHGFGNTRTSWKILLSFWKLDAEAQKRHLHKVISFQRLQTKTENTSSSFLLKNMRRKQADDRGYARRNHKLPFPPKGEASFCAEQPWHSCCYRMAASHPSRGGMKYPISHIFMRLTAQCIAMDRLFKGEFCPRMANNFTGKFLFFLPSFLFYCSGKKTASLRDTHSHVTNV